MSTHVDAPDQGMSSLAETGEDRGSDCEEETGTFCPGTGSLDNDLVARSTRRFESQTDVILRP